MKKLLSMFLACVLLLGILPTSAWAADSVEAALGEVDIYNGGYELGYLSINGAVKKQDYTYFMYKSNDGTTKEVPAYCVNPYLKGVPQKVEPGESIKYLAEERSSDPKVVGIISNGYPHRSLGELNLDILSCVLGSRLFNSSICMSAGVFLLCSFNVRAMAFMPLPPV